MKIVLDTNVIVSGFLTPHGNPAQILALILEGRVTLCIDSRIAHEYREVLSRPAFRFAPEDVADVLRVLLDDAVVVNPSPLDIKLPDPDDLIFVETASAADADALVTGNKRHFPAKALRGITLLSPAEFISLIAKPV